MEFTLLGAAATAVGAVWLWTRRDAALSEVDDPFGLLVGAALVGLVVGRVSAMLVNGTNPLSLDLFLVRGGVSTIGASLGAVAWIAWSNRHDLRTVDLLAPAALAGLAGWHLGCVVRQSCLGAATSMPWGWSVAGSPVDRHPVELYAAVALIAGAAAVAAIRSRTQVVGAVSLSGAGIAGLVRFATEPLRLTLGQLQWFYGLVAIIGLLGASILAIRHSHEHG